MIYRKTIALLKLLLLRTRTAKIFYDEILRSDFYGLNKIVDLLYKDKDKIDKQLERELVRITKFRESDFYLDNTLQFYFDDSEKSLLNKCTQMEKNLLWQFNETLKKEILGEVIPVIAKQTLILDHSYESLLKFIAQYKENLFNKEMKINQLNPEVNSESLTVIN